MDLKDNNILVGELLDNSKARQVIGKYFGELMHHPMLPMARKMRLGQLLALAQKNVSPQLVRQALEELERI